jgi:hypothetical protein
MKRNELEAAFTPIPKDCYDALMSAAQSVQEERIVKRKLSVALVFAISLVLIAGVALAVALSLRDTGRQVIQTEQTEGYYEVWPEAEKVSLVNALVELGYTEKTPEIESLLAGTLESKDAVRVADEAVAKFTGLSLSEISFMGIMEAAWGEFEDWTREEQAWYSQLMVDVGFEKDGHTFYVEPTGPVTEEQAIAIAKKDIAAAYGIEESVLDACTRYTSFQIPEFAKPGDTQAYWMVEYLQPMDSEIELPFGIGIGLFVHPDTGELLQTAQEVIDERNAVNEYTKDPLLLVEEVFYEKYGRPEDDIGHEARARYSQEIVPIIRQLAEKYPDFYIAYMMAPTMFVYGIPDENALSEKEAQALAEDVLVNELGRKQEELQFFTHKIRVFYDITNPEKPLWKFLFSDPHMYEDEAAVIAYYGKQQKNYPPFYKVEMDAFTGEITKAVPVYRLTDVRSMEKVILFY